MIGEAVSSSFTNIDLLKASQVSNNIISYNIISFESYFILQSKQSHVES
jgi:hypothetical protein